MTIPNIIHQIWIGNLPQPKHMMQTWISKHSPTTEYRLWTDSDLQNLQWKCQTQIETCIELCGIADIMRLEILLKYGGVFVDADSVCIEPFDDFIWNRRAFVAFENEKMRTGLVANGMMGFPPNDPLIQDMITEIASGRLDDDIRTHRAWQVTGPVLLTRFLNTGKYAHVSVFPSHYFYPEHHTQCMPIYDGHKKVYAYQAWATSNQSYRTLDTHAIPVSLQCEPPTWVSVLITSYNTPLKFLQECLDSIRMQQGYFGMEIVWINDGSNTECTTHLESELGAFQSSSRFCKVVYMAFPTNQGVAVAANRGLELCHHEIVFKMDADDIMHPARMWTQMEYMRNHPECQLCGTQIKMFYVDDVTGKKQIHRITEHPSRITLKYIRQTQSKWFVNHPTICFRKSLVSSVGGYCLKKELRVIHDYELMVRILRIKHIEIHNLSECLLYYRLHNDQLTHQLSMDIETDNIQNCILYHDDDDD